MYLNQFKMCALFSGLVNPPPPPPTPPSYQEQSTCVQLLGLVNSDARKYMAVRPLSGIPFLFMLTLTP